MNDSEKLDVLMSDVKELKSDVKELKSDVKELKSDVKVIKRHLDIDEERENIRTMVRAGSASALERAAKSK